MDSQGDKLSPSPEPEAVENEEFRSKSIYILYQPDLEERLNDLINEEDDPSRIIPVPIYQKQSKMGSSYCYKIHPAELSLSQRTTLAHGMMDVTRSSFMVRDIDIYPILGARNPVVAHDLGNRPLRPDPETKWIRKTFWQRYVKQRLQQDDHVAELLREEVERNLDRIEGRLPFRNRGLSSQTFAASLPSSDGMDLHHMVAALPDIQPSFLALSLREGLSSRSDIDLGHGTPSTEREGQGRDDLSIGSTHTLGATEAEEAELGICRHTLLSEHPVHRRKSLPHDYHQPHWYPYKPNPLQRLALDLERRKTGVIEVEKVTSRRNSEPRWFFSRDARAWQEAEIPLEMTSSTENDRAQHEAQRVSSDDNEPTSSDDANNENKEIDAEVAEAVGESRRPSDPQNQGMPPSEASTDKEAKRE